MDTPQTTTEQPRFRLHWTIWVWLLIALIYVFFPTSPWDKLAIIGFAIDPQRPNHSIYFGDDYMPVEARKTGMFGGFLIGLVVFALRGRGRAAEYPRTAITVLIFILAGSMVIDGFNAVFYDLYRPHLYPPNPYLRLGTGLLCGLALAAFIGPAFNQTVWRNRQPIASVPSVRALVEVLLAYAVYFGLVFSNWPPLFYPVSAIAAFGLLILVLMMATTFVMPMLRRENTARSLLDLAPYALIGLVIVLFFFGPMAGLRWLLFGWGPMPALR